MLYDILRPLGELSVLESEARSILMEETRTLSEASLRERVDNYYSTRGRLREIRDFIVGVPFRIKAYEETLKKNQTK